MNRIHRQQCRHAFERRRRAAADRRTSNAAARAKREHAIRAALSSCDSRRVGVPYFDSDECTIVFERAPRLAVAPYAEAVVLLLLTRSWTKRSVADWRPRGKGRDALFRSLGEHLLAKFPVPTVLWAGFFEEDAHWFAPLVAHVAGGGSLFDFVTRTHFPIKLTRAMCHELLSARSCGSLLEAIRRVQVRFAGGDDRLFRAWMGTGQARGIWTAEGEAFWFTVLGWFARCKTLDPSQVAPLVDYVADRHRQDQEFSISGRGLAALTRAMNDWHRDPARERVVHNALLPQSGYAPMMVDRSTRDRDGQRRERIWRVEPVRTTRQLFDEGRRMNHCVYSYLESIQKGFTSIWTMTLEDGSGPTGSWAMLTVEVRRDLRRIVQARGRFNRAATGEELAILQAWASRNALDVSLFT
jgi:hypothetical protein